MSVPNNKRKVQVIADGTTGPFSFDFLIFDSTHLIVFESNTDGTNAVLKLEGTDYTVAGVGNPAGGSITYVGGKEPPSGTMITMKRVVPLTQLTDYVENDPFPAETHEKALDLLTMICIQLDEASDRSIILPDTTPLDTLEFPDPSDPNNVGKAIIITGSGALGVATISGTGEISLLDGKGQLVGHDGSGGVKIPAPTSGSKRVLTEDAAAASGLAWKPSDGGVSNTFSGIMLTNLLDQDGRANKVTMLENANAAVTTDLGTRVRPKRELVVDLTASGAGGIDTGSRVANRWYSIWYCFKGPGASSPDNPDNPMDDALVAHREPLPVSIEFANISNAGAKINSASTNQKVAQSFSHATNNWHIIHVLVRLSRVGNPTGSIWFTIEGDNSGEPDGTPIGTTKKKSCARIQGADEQLGFEFPTPVDLTSGTTYWIVANVDYATDAINHLEWRKDTAGTYAGHNASDFNGTVWTARSGEDQHFIFQGWDDAAGSERSSVTLPTGYTEKAMIGFAMNNSSNVLKPFWSMDNVIYPSSNNADVGDWWNDNVPTSRAAVGFPAQVPPCYAMVKFKMASDISAARRLSLGTHDAFDIAVGNMREGTAHASMTTGTFDTADVENNHLGPLFVDRAVMMWQSNSASGVSFYWKEIKWIPGGGVLTQP